MLGKTFVPPAGERSALLVFIGQSPGHEEERRGEPFVGPAGRELQDACARAAIRWEATYRTNVFKYLLRAREREQIEALIERRWREWLLRELSQLTRARLIMTFGNEALFALIGEWGITAHRGQVYRSPYATLPPVLASVHPSFVMRQRGSEWQSRFRSDLREARALLLREVAAR